jgi:hypothetical protein
MKIVYFDSFDYVDGYNELITTTRYNFIQAALYITQNEFVEHLIQRDQIRRGITLYYHDTFIDFTLFDDNTTLKDVMLHYSIDSPGFIEIIDVLHDLTQFAKKDVSLQNIKIIPMTYSHDSMNDSTIQGIIELILWALYNSIVSKTAALTTTSFHEPDGSIDSLFVHGGGPSATLTLGVLSVFLQTYTEIKNFKGASMGSILATFVCINPIHELYERFINAVTKHVFRNGLNKPEVSIPLNYQETLTFIRLFLGESIARLTLQEFHDLHLAPHNKTLDILVTDVSICNYSIFNNITKPNVLLEDALMCSCGVPFVVGLKDIENKRYCDGDLYSYNYLHDHPNTYRILLTFQDSNTKTFDKNMFGSFCSPGAPLYCVIETVEYYVELFLKNLDTCGKHPLTINVPIREYLPMLHATPLLGSRNYHILNYQYGVDWALEHMCS